MDQVINEQAELQEKIEAADAWDLDRTVDIAMDALRCPPGDADVGALSGGERRRVALCRLLLSKPDMLLLDEPMAGLSKAERGFMTELIMSLKPDITVVIIEHDIDVAFSIADTVTVLDHGAVVPLWFLVEAGWRDMLVLSHVKEGEQSTVWRDHIKTMDLLILWLSEQRQGDIAHLGADSGPS